MAVVLEAGKFFSENTLLRSSQLVMDLGMRKSLQKYVILLGIWGFHGGADNMKFLKMFVRVFTCKAMKLWKKMDQSSFKEHMGHPH